MSLHAHQTEENFTARRLCNWEASTRYESKKSAILRPKSGTTRIIVDANGHLLPGVPKVNNAFAPPNDPSKHPSVPRWPQHNATIATGGAATMGYKGVETAYLRRTGPVTHTRIFKDGHKETNFQ